MRRYLYALHAIWQSMFNLHYARFDYSHQNLLNNCFHCTYNLMLLSDSIATVNVFDKLKHGSIIFSSWDIHWTVHLLLWQMHTSLEMWACNRPACLRIICPRLHHCDELDWFASGFPDAYDARTTYCMLWVTKTYVTSFSNICMIGCNKQIHQLLAVYLGSGDNGLSSLVVERSTEVCTCYSSIYISMDISNWKWLSRALQ